MRLPPALPVICLLVLALTGCLKPPAPPAAGGMPPMPAGVAAPIARLVALERELTGRIEAVDSVALHARTTGYIARVHVADGAEVAAGQVIASLDPAPMDAALAQAEARIAAALAREQQAAARLKRRQPLVELKVISEQDLDDDRAAATAAAADTAAARAALVQSRLERDWSEIKAPFAGRIGTVHVSVGTLAQGPGGPEPTLIADLVSTDPVEVVCDLEEDLYRRHAGFIVGAPVQVGSVGEDGLPHRGTVASVDNRIVPGAGTIRLRARLPNPQRTLVPGAFAKVRLALTPPQPVLLVHEQAVRADAGGRNVLTIDTDHRTVSKPVQLGDRVGPLRIVTGLDPADRVIVIGQAKVMGPPGTTVAPYPVAMDTLQPAAPATEAGTPGKAAP
jgi:RND family efflux transporter MFP subunit